MKYAILTAFFLTLAACPAPPPTPDGGNADGGQCTTFATEHELLLNAPTTADVVHKDPVVTLLPDGGLP